MFKSYFMKVFKNNFLLMVITAAIFSSCALPTSYIGDTFTPTENVDVFYAAKDVKKDYRVIGHISSQASANENDAKQGIINKAKKIGADGVIILGVDFTGGKDSTPFFKSEAIKYKE